MTLLGVAAASLGLAAAPLAASAAPAERVEICHYDADLGVYKLIKVAPTAVAAHLTNHPDGKPGGDVPDRRGYTFTSTCAVAPPTVVDFDDVVLTSPEVQLASYAGFTWTKAWVFSPTNAPQYGYGVNTPPNIGFIGFPQDSQPLVAVRSAGDVSFVSVFLTNPTASATDPDGTITVTIKAFDDAVLKGTVDVSLDPGESESATLPFDSVDRLELSAGGKYFGIDDLTYFLPAS
jgi:hypothetical protein